MDVQGGKNAFQRHSDRKRGKGSSSINPGWEWLHQVTLLRLHIASSPMPGTNCSKRPRARNWRSANWRRRCRPLEWGGQSRSCPPVRSRTSSFIFLSKLCIVLLVIEVIGGIAASAIEKQVGQLSASRGGESSFLWGPSSRSRIVRDVRATPAESKEALRRNIAVIARSLAPFTDAWRNPEAVPEPEGDSA